MKKLFFSSALIFLTQTIYSLPTGNPSEASLLTEGIFFETPCSSPCELCYTWIDAFSYRVGFYGDYVFNQPMEMVGDFDSESEEAEIFTNAFYAAFNFWEVFDIFGTLGATNFNIDNDSDAFHLNVESGTDFSWSVGARATLFEYGCTSFGVEAQYFWTKPNIKEMTIGDVAVIFDDSEKVKYHEWQFGAGVSRKMNMFIPYAAVKWSKSDIVFDDFVLPPLDIPPFDHLKSKRHWGCAIGITFIAWQNSALTVEGRFANENALYVNGQVRF